jgi:hypothetical protein
MAATKQTENVIVLLLEEGYSKLDEQENSGWGTFISGKKKLRVCLLPTANGADCSFLTTRLVRAEMHLRSHSKHSKSRNINLDQILEKLQKREIRNSTVSKRKLLNGRITVYVLLQLYLILE